MHYSYSLNKTQSLLIDLIRMLSAQGVLIGHLLFWDGFLSKDSFPYIFGLASYCVIIFFVLSGFLICLSAINKKEYTFKMFLIDRFSRIYTVYVPALFFVFLLDYCVSRVTHQPFYFGLYIKELIGNLLMLQEFPVFEFLKSATGINYFYLPYLGSDLPLWSLSIEWWLYLFFGWIMLNKTKSVFLKFALLGIFSIVPLYHLFVGSHMGPGIVIYWFMGALFPFLLATFSNKFNIAKQFIFFILLIGALGFSYSFFAGAFIFMFGFFLSLKHYEINSSIKMEKFSKIIRLGADFSFSLYLIHYTLIITIFSLVPQLNNLNSPLKFIVVFLIVNALALGFASVTEFKHKKINKYIKTKFT